MAMRLTPAVAKLNAGKRLSIAFRLLPGHYQPAQPTSLV